MSSTKPPCGHSVLRPGCEDCQTLLTKWYKKLEKDPDWIDIEYGLDAPPLIYQPVDVSTINPLATAYYDKVWAVYHDWIKKGRSRRDCMVCELMAKQEGETGTERGISAFLKSKRMKPNSRFMVRRTIKEINCIVLKIAQARPSVEQAFKALRPVDSKPLEDDANGQNNHDQQVAHSRAS